MTQRTRRLATSGAALAWVAVAALCGAAARSARADAAGALAEDIVGAPLQPAAGELVLALSWERDISERVGGSAALAPDVRWGLSDQTTLAWTHSPASIARIGNAGGICVQDCELRQAAYAAAAFAQHALVQRKGFDLAALGGGLLRDLSPTKLAAFAGAAARWHRGRWALDATGYVQLGVTNTDRGNRHRLVMLARAWVQPTCRWALAFGTGFDSELAVLRDGHHIPLLVAARARATERLSVTATLGASSLLGAQNTSRYRFASIGIEARY